MTITLPLIYFPPSYYAVAALLLLVVTAASLLGLLDRAAPIRLFLGLALIWGVIHLPLWLSHLSVS